MESESYHLLVLQAMIVLFLKFVMWQQRGVFSNLSNAWLTVMGEALVLINQHILELR